MTASTSSASLLRVAIAGASGRMGHMLIEAVLASGDCQLAAALDMPGSPSLGQEAAAFLGKTTGVLIESDVRAALAKADVLIDFTRPEGTLAHLAVAAELGVKVVIGTTGFSDAEKAQIAAVAQKTAVILSANMSTGVNVTFKLLEMAAKALQEGGYDIEIIEAHHKHKVDAPSGTALKMGEVIAEAQGTQLADRAVYERYGHTGERKPDSIGFATVRGGDIVGDHTVLFAGTGERVEISHKSSSRAGYAQGSLRAARFLAGKATGQFDMFDVLSLR
ncbi:MAG: 4-hydroxy-tetrahydrodipicolinate reductase [Comamonas sp.]